MHLHQVCNQRALQLHCTHKIAKLYLEARSPNCAFSPRQHTRATMYVTYAMCGLTCSRPQAQNQLHAERFSLKHGQSAHEASTESRLQGNCELATGEHEAGVVEASWQVGLGFGFALRAHIHRLAKRCKLVLYFHTDGES